MATTGASPVSGSVATTLPPRSVVTSQPRSWKRSAIQAARFSSKNVGAGTRHRAKCCRLTQLRSRRNQSRQPATAGVWANSERVRATEDKLQSTAGVKSGKAECPQLSYDD